MSKREHAATRCKTLQNAATHCNTLQQTLTSKREGARVTSETKVNGKDKNVLLQHTATHCNTLQHTATHCNTLHHTATHCNTLQHTASHCNPLQHIVMSTEKTRENFAVDIDLRPESWHTYLLGAYESCHALNESCHTGEVCSHSSHSTSVLLPQCPHNVRVP